MTKPFTPFDPLEAKQTPNADVAINAVKREIKNILDSYVGWFDPFCELIQNSLDAVEEREKEEEPNYTPEIFIRIDLKDNKLTVSDNGVGLDEAKFKQFLAPSFSFKSKKKGNRGHKGVGATYLAYGFDYMRISTKTKDFSSSGKIENAKRWLGDENPAGNPMILPDNSTEVDINFVNINRGVSITLGFNKNTYPSKLDWLGADNANVWYRILAIKTGLGSISANDKVIINIEVIDTASNKTVLKQVGTEYFWPHRLNIKSANFFEIQKKETELFAKKGTHFKMPSEFTNLDCFWGFLAKDEIASFIKLTEEEIENIEIFQPNIYFSYLYSAKIWNTFDEELNIRKNYRILHGGIQLAADNMPQGEIIPIPLQRGTDRQNRVHIVIHFSNATADLGRKGFHKDVVLFSQEIARKLVEGPLQKMRDKLRPITGAAPDLIRQNAIEDWKNKFTEYEKTNKLEITNPNFFLPTKKISITSQPSREQDVIALFNQLLAGGVIRGIKIMATDERFTYDGLYKISFEPPNANHIYDKQENPLGVLKDVAISFDSFESNPKVLEYKKSFDGLIENIEDESKNSNDIGLVVVWETGEDFRSLFAFTSLLDDNNLNLRQYHGVTHIVTNLQTGQREMDLIVLSELIDYLNDPDETKKAQKIKYED